MTVWEALRAAGIPSDEAELLLRTVTGWTAAEAVARRGEPLPAPALRAFSRLCQTRASGVPVQHLGGRVDFYGTRLATSPEALIPRPDTETLVEAALPRLDTPDPLAADIGCGSGAVAIALATRARVVAVERSPRALRLARENIRALGLENRVRLVAGDLMTAFRPGVFDLVAANLPYVAEPDFPEMAVEVREHEPREALAGGADGLDPLRRLAPQAAAALQPGKPLLAEIGAGQAEAAADILAKAGFEAIETRPDLAGIPRVVMGRQKESFPRLAR